ncbi:MAG: hypothetical protein PVG65_06295 [Candidatus Thorarchaeota archaeon]|jgi:hypothetical protein
MDKKAPKNQLTKVIMKTPMNPPGKLRILVALILIYYIWILLSVWSMYGQWWWDLEQGLMWASSDPGQFFPIPKPPGPEAMITQAYPHDHIFYLFFIQSGIWIIWLSLGSLLLSPYRIDFRTLFISIRTKLGFRKIS